MTISRGESVDKHALINEGMPTIGVIVILGIGLFFITPWASLFAVGLLLFVLYFFRDPNRISPIDEGIVVSAADGLVTGVDEIIEESYIGGKATRISIFLSPLDVHVNRSPIEGKVEYVNYVKGRFVPATRKDCHDVNEKNYIGISNGMRRILVVQVAGIMARRIVNWTVIGDELKQGSKIGMIKFSSGTQIIVPSDVEVVVKVGDRVISGQTVVGKVIS